AALPATDTAPRASPSPTRILTLLRAAAEVSKKLLPMFIGFAFLGYLLNSLIPASWISALFGKGHAYSVPLAATIGLPLYVSSEASLPLVRALLDSGMSQGAIMAFLIAGSGTSIGAITGALTIARWKVVGIVVAVLWVGAILAGYGFDVLVAAGLA
ncbi:MAG: permease, partial [Rectinemataceae bacterium]